MSFRASLAWLLFDSKCSKEISREDSSKGHLTIFVPTSICDLISLQELLSSIPVLLSIFSFPYVDREPKGQKPTAEILFRPNDYFSIFLSFLLFYISFYIVWRGHDEKANKRECCLYVNHADMCVCVFYGCVGWGGSRCRSYTVIKRSSCM